ncbi:LPS export ABC transporter periplasmic protein LptC [Pelosinus baikalensis]|uniref:LPS export ABC transporter periplasmic protein LptC n=1 Tax=Pelosinus baikalensis TaxID=2892015 RepID=A0ABS8HNN6_9FIRM|nr:LPS export ABC transporter periplasmic protein LptC [Pelosinus baikalensis]MCC5464174.1 LPS export ABC transporter periplasmic protein LptC [Pelosinus baikalensis]
MKKKAGMILACIIILVSGLYYFLKDEPLAQAPPEEPKDQQTSKLAYVGNSIVEQKDGKPLWELKAEFIEIDVDTKNVQLKNLVGTFYQEKGGKIEITAPEAFVDSKTKDITMSVKVQATASDGTTFTANEARWSSTDQKVYGSGNVILTKDDTVLTGDKIESDSNMEKIKVFGNAKVVKGGVSK